MDIVIVGIIAIAAGAAIGLLIARSRNNEGANNTEQTTRLTEENTKLVAHAEVLAAEKKNLEQQLRDKEEAHNNRIDELKRQHQEAMETQQKSADTLLLRERELRADELNRLNTGYDRQMAELKEQIVNERNYAKEMIDAANESLKKEKEHSEAMRQENDRQWTQKLETLKQEMQKTAAEELARKQSALQDNNRTQMDELLRPIKEQFAEFKRSVEESKTQNEVNKKELRSAFEATMKLFQQEQQQTVLLLKEQTERIGTDAANLTKALKGESKTQGDWGEMVLEMVLENSGLQKGEEFFIQETVKDEEGGAYRPDVIVRFPEGRSVVIDSKVSLTAYAEAVATEDEKERERLLREHAKSVRKHVDELAEKSYDKVVSDAIGFVLMFVPNENSYIAAMKQQPDLSRYAYQKRIIIISPSNLLMALQLAYNLWQYDRQSKNVEKIVKTAADLYDKVAGFEDTFTDIEGQIDKLNKTFDKAKDQLYEGKGNVMRRVEMLRSLGVTPKKQIKSLEDTSEA